MFTHKDRSRFHLGRNLIFLVILTTITLLTAAGSNAAVFSFMGPVNDLFGLTPTGTAAPILNAKRPSESLFQSLMPTAKMVKITGLDAAATVSRDDRGLDRLSFMTVFDVPPPTVSLVSIAVTPSNATILLPGSQQFTATGTFSDSSTRVLANAPATWTSKAGMAASGRSNFAAATLLGKIYVAGGGQSSGSLTSVEAYDPTANSWSSVASLPAARYAGSAATVADKMYVIGGMGPGVCGAGLDGANLAYDPGTDMWTARASMPTPRASVGLVAINGLIYAAGGYNILSCASNGLATLEVYDSTANSWTARASMPLTREKPATTTTGGKIYVIGGYTIPVTARNDLQIYDPGTNSWSAGAPMPTARGDLSAIAVNGKIYAIGGYDGGSIVNKVEVYDPVTNKWSAGPNMITGRSDSSTAELNGTAYTLGGCPPSFCYPAVTTNEALALGEVSWSSSNSATATIGLTGLASAAAYGSTSITATNGTISGSTGLLVDSVLPPLTEVAFSSAAYIEDESQSAVITISRTGDVSGTTTVSFSTVGGTATGGAICSAGVDYMSVTNQVVTFNPNETTQSKFVNVCGDALTEPAQTVNLVLNGSNVGTPGTAVLTINDTANMFRSVSSIDSLGNPAAPYPSSINVIGAPNEIGSMRVTLYDFFAQSPDNIDALLVGPGGQKFILMADTGGMLPINSNATVTLTFSDGAGQVLPDSASMTTGQYEPTSWEPGQADFPPNAPAAPYNEPGGPVGGTGSQTFFGNFGGTNSNGFWKLYVRDDTGMFAPITQFGSIAGGWGLEFVAPPPPIDLVFDSSGNLPPGTYHNITINAPAEVSMTSGIVITGTLTINNGGRLNTNNFVLSGAGSFVLADGGWLQIGSPNGITTVPDASGNIQTAGRSFSQLGSYIYAGTGNQSVGNGLPSTVASLTINNSGIEGNNTVTGNLWEQIVTGTLEIIDGIYESHSDYVDVIIDAGGTLELNDNITVSGNWTNNEGTLISNAHSVTFDGGNGQTISGTTTFYSFIKSNGGGQTMYFAAGSSTIVSNSLNFTGAVGVGNALALRSTVSGSQWDIAAPTSQSINYVDVKDSNASGGNLVTAANSFDSGNNANWSISVPSHSIKFSSATFSTAEGLAGSVPVGQVTVTRTGATGYPASVYFATSNSSSDPATPGPCGTQGVDYETVSVRLDFVADEINKYVNIPICPDTIFEGDETIDLTLSQPGGGAILDEPSTAVLTITEDDPMPQFSIDSPSQNEGNSGSKDFTFTIRKTGPTSFTYTTYFDTVDETATVADNDYQPIETPGFQGDGPVPANSVTFGPDEYIKTISVLVNGDTNVEADETFRLKINHISGGPIIKPNADQPSIISGIGTILNDDCTPPPEGMIAWWPGDGNGADIKGGRNGTPLNGAGYDPGKVDQAFKFDGSDDVVHIPDDPAWDLTGPAFTIDTWFKLRALGGRPMQPGPQVLVAHDDAGGFNNKWIFWLSGGQLELHYNNTSGEAVYIGVPFNPDHNVWYHVAVTRDGSAYRFFVNGLQVDTVQPEAQVIPNASAPLSIGRAEAIQSFDGLIDEVEIFNVALDPLKIKAIYDASSAGKCHSCTPPPSGMVGWWPGENNANDIVGLNNGTLQNGAGFADGKVGRAISLDGTTQFVEAPDSPGLRLPNAITLDTWVNLADVSGNKPIIGKGQTSGNWFSYYLAVSDGAIYFELDDWSTGHYGVWKSASVISPSTWYHVSATWQNQFGDVRDAKIYLNGVEQVINLAFNQGYGPTFSLYYTDLPLFLGRDVTAGNHFKGMLDELEIFDRVLSQAEIQAIYDAGSAGKCHSCTVPPQNMISWWQGEGNATDLVGSNDGTPFGSVSFVPGKVGQAFKFDAATNTGIIVPPSASINPTEAITLDAWVKPTSFPNGGPVVFRKDQGGGITQYGLSVGDGLTPGIAHCNVGGANGATGGTIPLGHWTHLACTYDRQMVRIFINGVEAASAPVTLPIPTAETDLAIGMEEFFTERNFDGLIDEAEIFSRALSQDEILRIYNAGSAGKCPITTVQTTTTVSSSANPSVYGDNVTFTAAVLPVPTGGTVQFNIDGSDVGLPVTLDAMGAAAISTAALIVNGGVPHIVSANYSGFEDFDPSSGLLPLGQTVNPRPAIWTTNNADKVFGADDPIPLTSGNGSGFLPADNVTATYSRFAGEASSPPTYHITATLTLGGNQRALNGVGDLNNYSITNNGAEFTIFSRNLSGTVTLANAPATLVPDVVMSAAGDPPSVPNGLTNAAGAYTMTGFGTGLYTITPSKTPYPQYAYNGVFSNDATLISRHVVGLITLTPEQLKAGKVSGLPNLSSFEAALVAQYIVGIPNPINRTGMWEFSPVSTSLIVSTNSTADFKATLMGDVNGDWTECADFGVICSHPEEITDPGRIRNAVQISVASYKVSPGIEVIVPLSISNLKTKKIDSYQFDIEYDPDVIAPADVAASLAGTMSEGMAIAFNVPQKGLLKVVAYGAYPKKGDGIYVNLRFRIIGSEGTRSPLMIRNFRFNDGSSDVYSTTGWLYVVSEEGGTAKK